MKVRNKKTGEIQEWDTVGLIDHNRISDVWVECGSIARLNEDWEDYEEPNYWVVDYITCGVDNVIIDTKEPEMDDFNKQIGNYFESKEEAEKAVEKLKAIRRLNKCGFKFEGYTDRDRADGGSIVIYASVNIPNNNLLEEAQPAMLKDLDLLFGGKE